jgi:hypothetical protein
VIEIPLHGLHGPAQERADATPELRRSMRGRLGNEVGAMGELVAMRYFDMIGVKYRDEGQINHDLWTAHGTVDVKSKERTVRPQKHYDCTVPDYNTEVQLPDWYLFVSLLSEKKSRGTSRFKQGWVLGSMGRQQFHDCATLWEPGTHDASNDWEATIPCWNVPVSQLRPPRQPDL